MITQDFLNEVETLQLLVEYSQIYKSGQFNWKKDKDKRFVKNRRPISLLKLDAKLV